MRSAKVLGLALWCMTLAGTAWSQTPEERAGARAAATDGARAFNEGRWADTIDRMSRAESLVHSPTHLLYIARSHEKLGQLVRAQEVYLQVAREQLTPDAPQAFRDAQTQARDAVAALRPRIPYVSVVVQGAGAQQVVVTMDGVRVPEALVGVPRPVDPGQHRFAAQTPESRATDTMVTIEEGARETVVLTLRENAPAAAPAPTQPAPPPVEQPAPAQQQQPAPPVADAGPQEEGTNWMRIGSYIGFGVAGVGLIAGTIFIVSANGNESDADDICNLPGGECPDTRRAEVEQLDDDAASNRSLATVSFIVGGVGLAAGGVLLGLSFSDSSDSAAGVRPWVGLGTVGLNGRF